MIFILLIPLTAGWFLTPQDVHGIPLCVFKWATGLDCPGCGLTRSFLVLARGHLFEAIHYNAAGPLIYLFFVFTLIDRLLEKFFPKSQIFLPPKAGVVYGSLVFVTLFGHWILRFISQWPGKWSFL